MTIAIAVVHQGIEDDGSERPVWEKFFDRGKWEGEDFLKHRADTKHGILLKYIYICKYVYHCFCILYICGLYHISISYMILYTCKVVQHLARLRPFFWSEIPTCSRHRSREVKFQLYRCKKLYPQMSNEKRDPGCLGYIGDFTTQLYRDFDKP